MKRPLIFLLTIIITACGPSNAQLTETAQAAVAQTETAAPTATATHTPTATFTPTITPSPTITPTPTPIPPVVVEHPTPTGQKPSGFPRNAKSDYLETSSSGFSIKVPAENEPLTMSYFVTIDVIQSLPENALIEIYLENPETPGTAILIQKLAPLPEDRIVIISDPLGGFQCRNYWVDIHIYEDATKTVELGTHLQWIASSFDASKYKDITDILNGSAC